mgnify:CR=1 FL=1
MTVDPTYPLPKFSGSIVREETVPPAPIVAVILAGEGSTLPSTINPIDY